MCGKSKEKVDVFYILDSSKLHSVQFVSVADNLKAHQRIPACAKEESPTCFELFYTLLAAYRHMKIKKKH